MIVVVGFMGAGKSTIGKLIAKHLDVPFTDTDKVIEDRHGPISEYFDRYGEPAFRTVEAQVIAECLGGPDGVLALGGGAVAAPEVRDALRGHEVLWLRISLANALARVGQDPRRPVLASADLDQRFEQRQHWYADVATRILDVGHGPARDVAERYFAPPA